VPAHSQERQRKPATSGREFEDGPGSPAECSAERTDLVWVDLRRVVVRAGTLLVIEVAEIGTVTESCYDIDEAAAWSQVVVVVCDRG